MSNLKSVWMPTFKSKWYTPWNYFRGESVYVSPISVPVDIWLDASALDTIKDVSGDVYQWNDRSGHWRHVIQAVGSRQPLTGVNTINGLNVINFASVNLQYLKTLDPATWLNGKEFHIFTVVKPAVVTDVHYYTGTLQNANNKGLHCGYSANDKYKIDFFNDDNEFTVTRGTAAINLYVSYTDPGSDLYENGVKNAGSSTSLPANDLATEKSFTVGMGYRQSTDTWEGTIAELLVKTGPMSVSEIQEAIDYLDAKWGT